MSAAAIIGVVAAAYALLRALLNSSQSPQEPPPVLTTIPFLGPIIDMVRWGAEFYVKLKFVGSPVCHQSLLKLQSLLPSGN